MKFSFANMTFLDMFQCRTSADCGHFERRNVFAINANAESAWRPIARCSVCPRPLWALYIYYVLTNSHLSRFSSLPSTFLVNFTIKMAPVALLKRDPEGVQSPDEFTVAAKAGTAVAIVIVIVGFSVFCWLEWRRRRRIKQVIRRGHDTDHDHDASYRSDKQSHRSRRSHQRTHRIVSRAESSLEPLPQLSIRQSTSRRSSRQRQQDTITEKLPSSQRQSKDLLIEDDNRPTIEGFFPPRIPLPNRARLRD